MNKDSLPPGTMCRGMWAPSRLLGLYRINDHRPYDLNLRMIKTEWSWITTCVVDLALVLAQCTVDENDWCLILTSRESIVGWVHRNDVEQYP